MTSKQIWPHIYNEDILLFSENIRICCSNCDTACYCNLYCKNGKCTYTVKNTYITGIRYIQTPTRFCMKCYNLFPECIFHKGEKLCTHCCNTAWKCSNCGKYGCSNNPQYILHHMSICQRQFPSIYGTSLKKDVLFKQMNKNPVWPQRQKRSKRV